MLDHAALIHSEGIPMGQLIPRATDLPWKFDFHFYLSLRSIQAASRALYKSFTFAIHRAKNLSNLTVNVLLRKGNASKQLLETSP